MPLCEIETHPFLNLQFGQNININQLDHYTKMIVGTFPIYAITNSEPIEQTGIDIKANWNNYADLNYFYGSKKNHFWQLFCSTFEVPIPVNVLSAITILNDNHFIITDIIQSTERKDYSPADSGLHNPILNKIQLYQILKNAKNLKIIYFTSQRAKQLFCSAMQIDYKQAIDDNQDISGNDYRLIELPLKLRQVPRFFPDFPLAPILRQKGYARIYAQSYYLHYLNLLNYPVNFTQ